MSASCWIANVKMGRDIFFSCFSQPLFFVTRERGRLPDKNLPKSFLKAFILGAGKCKGYIPDRLSNGLNISLGILEQTRDSTRVSEF